MTVSLVGAGEIIGCRGVGMRDAAECITHTHAITTNPMGLVGGGRKRLDQVVSRPGLVIPKNSPALWVLPGHRVASTPFHCIGSTTSRDEAR